MTEEKVVENGFDAYKKMGGVLNRSGYELVDSKIVGVERSASAISQAESMAKICRISLNYAQVFLYAYLREIEKDEADKLSDKRAIWGLSDQEVLAEVLLLTEDEQGLKKVKEFYKNIFGE